MASDNRSFLPQRSTAPAPGVEPSRLVGPRPPGAPSLATPSAAVVPCGPRGCPAPLLQSPSDGEDEKLPAASAPWPSCRDPSAEGRVPSLPASVRLIVSGWRGFGGTPRDHPPPPRTGEGRAGGTSCSLPPTLHACPSPAPYLAIPWVPPPLPYMVWGPLAEPLPCPWLHEWPRRSSVVQRRPNKARWPTAPHPCPRPLRLTPASSAYKAARPAPDTSACRPAEPSRARPADGESAPPRARPPSPPRQRAPAARHSFL